MFPHNSKTYYTFNQDIAINHVDIAHNPDKTLKACHFTDIYISSDPFDTIDIGALLSKMRTLVKYPLYVMVGSDWETAGSNSQTHSKINGAFIILQKAETNTDPDEARRQCYYKTEAIATQIAAYIKAYFEANTLLGHLEQMPIGEPIGPINIDGPCYGTKVSYTYISRYSNLAFDQTKFGNLKPEPEPEPDQIYF